MNNETEMRVAKPVAAKDKLVEINLDLAGSVGSSDQGGE